MKRLIILIPILFFGMQPHNQVIREDSVDSESKETHKFSIETDTMILRYSFEKLKEESKELEDLKAYRDKLKREIRQIQQQKQREEKEIEKIKEMFNKFDNRGL